MTFKFLALIAIAACAPMTGLVAAGDTPAATAERQYPVEHLKLAYAQSNSRLPALAKLDSVLLHLKSRDGQLFTTDPWLDWMRQQDPSLKWMRDENMAHMMDFEVAVGSNLPEGSKFSEAAIREVSKAVVARLNQLGVAGVVVLVSQNDIDPQSRADLRPSGNRTLNLVIWASEISQVRTVAKGDRLPADAAVNNPLHARILKGSPLTVATDGNPALLNKTELQDYLRRLNRQPGRTVEASISPATKPDATGQTVYDPGMVTVDYLVNESKPWTAYVQLSNTGTETTGRFRERIGASDSQVTNHDDIASLDYIGSSDFKTTSAIFGSYDYPLLFPDRLRAKVYGSWGDFNATTPALAGSAPGQFTGSSWTTGLDLTASPFAIQGFAIDFVVGAAAQHITVTDLALNRVGTVDLLTPHVTVRASRETEANKVSADIGWETNLNNVSADDLLRLGRRWRRQERRRQ